MTTKKAPLETPPIQGPAFPFQLGVQWLLDTLREEMEDSEPQLVPNTHISVDVQNVGPYSGSEAHIHSTSA